MKGTEYNTCWARFEGMVMRNYKKTQQNLLFFNGIVKKDRKGNSGLLTRSSTKA